MGEREMERREADAENFAELLMRPLRADDPQRNVLRYDLRERLEHVADADGGAAEAADWLRKEGPVGNRRRRMLALWGVALLIFAGCAGYEFRQLIPLLGSEGMGPEWVKEQAQRQLYTVPLEEAPTAMGWTRPLEEDLNPWMAHRDNPALYFVYAQTFAMRFRKLPPDYDATWRRIDPDNGIWLMIQAYSDSQVRFQRPPLNPAGAQALLREAAAKPRIEAYNEAWDQYVIDHLRVPVTAAEELAVRNRLSSQWAWSVFWQWGQGMTFTTDGLKTTTPGTPEWEAYQRIDQWIRTYPAREAARHAAKPRATKSTTALLTMVTPGCQVGLLVAALLLLIPAAGLLALRQFPARERAGRMAVCLDELERPGDRWKLLAIALPVPLALGVAGVMAIHPERPLAGLGMAAPVLMLMSMVMLAVAVASRQISRQTAFLGLESTPAQRKVTMGMAIAMLLILAMVTTLVVMNRVVELPQMSEPTPVLTAMGGLLGLLLLAPGVKALMGYTVPETNLRHRLIARRLLPVVSIFAIVLCLTALSLQVVERWAVRKNQQEEGMRPW